MWNNWDKLIKVSLIRGCYGAPKLLSTPSFLGESSRKGLLVSKKTNSGSTLIVESRRNLTPISTPTIRLGSRGFTEHKIWCVDSEVGEDFNFQECKISGVIILPTRILIPRLWSRSEIHWLRLRVPEIYSLSVEVGSLVCMRLYA